MAILKSGKTIGVVVHHSVYKPANNLTELKAQAKLFDGWHSSKSWAQTIKTGGEYGYQFIEYHYLIGLDGSLLQVQDEKYVLYHSGDNFRGVNSFNLHGIAVCLTGNYETDKPTPAQMLALVGLIRKVQTKYNIDALVRGHKQTSQTATACPGRNIGTSTSGWLKSVITNVNDKNYPPIIVQPPAPPVQSECEKEVERLEGIIKGLTEALATSQEGSKVLGERVEFLESTMAIRDKEYSDLESDYDRILEERDRNERDKLALQLKLDELNKPHWTEQLRDRLWELWEEFKERIIKFIKRE